MYIVLVHLCVLYMYQLKKIQRKKAREEKTQSKELEKQRKEQIRIAERERKKQMGGSKDCLQVNLEIRPI